MKLGEQLRLHWLDNKMEIRLREIPKHNLKILKLGGRAAQNTGRSGYRHNDAREGGERCDDVRGRGEISGGGGLDAPSKQRRSETETDAGKVCCSPMSAAFGKERHAIRGKTILQ